MNEERKMIRLEAIYRGHAVSIRYVGTPEELAEVVTRALKGNVKELKITREQPPYEASEVIKGPRSEGLIYS